MGTVFASTWAQRCSTELWLEFMQRFGSSELPLLEETAAAVPRFEKWVTLRRALLAHSRFPEWHVLAMFCYTDDPIAMLVGTERAVRAIDILCKFTSPRGANIKMGIEHERKNGVGFAWAGGSRLIIGLLEYIDEAKQFCTDVTKSAGAIINATVFSLKRCGAPAALVIEVLVVHP